MPPPHGSGEKNRVAFGNKPLSRWRGLGEGAGLAVIKCRFGRGFCPHPALSRKGRGFADCNRRVFVAGL